MAPAECFDSRESRSHMSIETERIFTFKPTFHPSWGPGVPPSPDLPLVPLSLLHRSIQGLLPILQS
jgi:hypothetical protein